MSQPLKPLYLRTGEQALLLSRRHFSERKIKARLSLRGGQKMPLQCALPLVAGVR